jgi:hypothetical protein
VDQDRNAARHNIVRVASQRVIVIDTGPVVANANRKDD